MGTQRTPTLSVPSIFTRPLLATGALFAAAALAFAWAAVFAAPAGAQELRISVAQPPGAGPAAGSEAAKLSRLVKSVRAQTNLVGYPACLIPNAGVSLNPASIDFGNVPYGTTSASHTVTVFNTGNKPLNVGSVTVLMPPLDSGSSYSVANGCATVAPGAACTIGVTFYAGDNFATTIPGILRVQSNAPGSPHSVPLSATITVTPTPTPNPTLTPTTVDFGVVPVGSSATKAFSYGNTGTAAYSISSLSVTGGGGDVTFQSDACSGTNVVPGGSCSVVVKYAPTFVTSSSAGVFAAASIILPTPTINIASVNPGPGALQLDSTDLDFGSWPQSFQSFTYIVGVQNTGAAPVTIGAISTAAPFTVDTGQTNCPIGPALLASGATCQIGVFYTAGTPGVDTGVLTVDTTVPTGSYQVNLTGTSTVPPPNAFVNPNFYDFGTVNVGQSATQNFVLTNNETSPVPFDVSTSGSQYSIGIFSGGCSGSLPSITVAASSTCTIPVTFTPSFDGFDSQSLVIFETLTGLNFDYSATLSGTGHQPGPVTSLSTFSTSFGAQVVGSTTLQTITVTNVGDQTLNMGSIATNAPFAIDPASTCVTAPAVAVGNSCTVIVSFAPTAIQNYFDTVTINSDSLNGTDFVSVDGSAAAAPAPAIDFLPGSLSFVSQPLCTTSQGQSISVANTGTAPLTISSIVATGEFTLTHDCPVSPATLAPLTCCTVAAKFAPQPGGSGAGSVDISSNATPATVSIPLSGVNDNSRVCAAPLGGLIFPDQIQGTTSAPLALQISNPGATPVILTSISASADFAWKRPPVPTPAVALPALECFTNTPGTAPYSLAGGQSCLAYFTFTPSLVGLDVGVASIATSAGSPRTAGLLGIGLSPTSPGISTSSDLLAFPGTVINTSSAKQDVVITSSGTTDLLIASITVSGPFAATNDCPAALPVGASCTVSVVFNPVAVAKVTGAVTIATNVPAPRVVQLTGEGIPVPAPILRASASGIGFGTQASGSTSRQGLTLTNGGNAPLVFQGIDVASPFSVVSNCGAVLAPAQSCALTVKYFANGAGGQTGTLSIRSNDPKGAASIALTGKTCRPFTIRQGRLGAAAGC